jgi:hypothetical protein
MVSMLVEDSEKVAFAWQQLAEWHNDSSLVRAGRAYLQANPVCQSEIEEP